MAERPAEAHGVPGRRPAPLGASAVVACLSLLLVGCGQAGATSPSVTGPTPAGAPSSSISEAPGSGSSPSSTAASGAATADSRPAPSRLSVPEIALDERLIRLGLASDGAMEVPEDPGRVGWFTGGGRPGGAGPTVLAGHVDSTDGAAVFADLTELEAGDEVHVDDSEGRRVTYRVDRVEDHPKGAFPTEEVFGATTNDELRLITCTGDWDDDAGQYTDNHIVYASVDAG